MKKGLALGCSHTAGVGIDYNDCYINLLSQHYKIPFKNLAVSGGNHILIEKNLINELKNDCPDIVIIQWPNIFRRTTWIDGKPHNETSTNASPVFKQLLQLGEENFYNPWLQAIITCNTICNLANTSVVNIMLENIDTNYHSLLNKEGIILHVDQKLPGLTWMFDSAADDNLHHSRYCHAQWAERIIKLIDEITSR